MEKNTEKQEIIFTEAEKGYALFCCIQGQIQLSKITADGREIVIKVIQPGEIFGEVILFESDLYPVTATALKPSRLYMIPKHQFLCLLEKQDFRNDFIALLMRKQRYLAEQIKYLTIHDVEDRFFRFIKEHYEGANRIKPELSKKDMAAAIGTTPETLSRLFNRLIKDKKIHWQGKWMVIDQP
ncbi:MAG: Crp/Fnr family transcriptional regulator [candidate division KSB1 bacterium]|nr:Crp/Fnr family transcriptional regulator [candidate division KSB1 bacterium]